MSSYDELKIDKANVIFRKEFDSLEFGLSRKEAFMQDMANEYVVVKDEKANGGIIVYAKHGNDWTVNPWSTRFLIRYLIDNLKEEVKNVSI